ncbi:MAG: glycosyltransferase family 4 protein [Clostridia bacterium]|nr:glycosyltransferase family 4 protein [Clostridia bacterium]
MTHFYAPEVGAATKRISGLARNLKKLGHDVEVITGFPNYPSGIKLPPYNHKVYMKEEIEGIKVYRFYVYASPKKNSITRLLNYITFMISSMFFILKRKKYDLIITSSPPLFIGLSGYVISRVKRIPLVFDIRDIWPDIALEMGEINEKSLMYKVLNKIAQFIHKKAELITVVTRKKKEKIITKGIEKEKLKVISNGFDTEFLDFKVDFDLVEQHTLNKKFNLIYTGVVGLAQGLDVIIETAQKVRDINDIRFLIIGDGVEKKDLEQKVFEQGLTNVDFLGVQPHEKILTFLKYSGAAIVPLKSDKLQDSVPTKMFEALGAGCPVILSASGESADILRESQGGIVVNPGDSNALKDAVLKLYNSREMCEKMAKKGQEYVLNNFTRESIAKNLSHILNNYRFGGIKK